MAINQELLRNIPKVDELLAHPMVVTIESGTLAVGVTREVISKLRESVLSGECTKLPEKDEIAAQIVARIRKNAIPSLRRVINATGVILHTNLGRAPLAKSVAETVRDVAVGYSTLEYKVEEGVRGSRHSHVGKLLVDLTGAEDALVVNNNAAAVLLTLIALCNQQEVIVSRGELIEIGGAFRVPDIMHQSGCVLKEVGTTNRTRISDYESAICAEQTGALLKAHTSNFKIVGFAEEVSLVDLVALGQKHGLPVLHDLGSGLLMPSEKMGMTDEPDVIGSIKAGADIVTFSGDKLLGGPQAGIILGKKELIEKIKKHPLARVLRIDKLTLAALEATLRLYLDLDKAKVEIPILRMLSALPCELHEKADRLVGLLINVKEQIRVVDDDGMVGGGSAPAYKLKSVAVEVAPRNITANALEKRLRACAIPIIAHIAHDRLLLNMRTIDEEDLPYVASCIVDALGDHA